MAAQGSDTSFAGSQSIWWTEGSTSTVSSSTTTGKSPAYDYCPFSELKLAGNLTDGYLIANPSSDSDASYSLLAVVSNRPYNSGDTGCNNGSSNWNTGFQNFTSFTRIGSFFSQNYIKIWNGDGQNDYDNRAVFSSGFGGHNDWSGSGTQGGVGVEHNMAGNNSSSKWYTVWIR